MRGFSGGGRVVEVAILIPGMCIYVCTCFTAAGASLVLVSEGWFSGYFVVGDATMIDEHVLPSPPWVVVAPLMATQAEHALLLYIGLSCFAGITRGERFVEEMVSWKSIAAPLECTVFFSFLGVGVGR